MQLSNETVNPVIILMVKNRKEDKRCLGSY